MKLLRHLLTGVIMTLVMTTKAAAPAASPYQVIPLPTRIQMGTGTWELPQDGLKVWLKGTTSTALTAYLSSNGLQASLAQSAGKAHLLITLTNKKQKAGSDWGEEGYTLVITPKQLQITAATETGAFYALQTLLQLTEEGSIRSIACCTIFDKPRFSYRGLHFDVSRHFRSKEFLCKQLDAMALLKMNRMHLHLTDGAGWRLAIDKYPRLTSYAAWRPARTWQEWADRGAKYCDQTHPEAQGGYYTKEDIRDILAYAAARHITVIPEIEMPGHSEEVLAAYPELSCDGTGKGSSDFCPGKEQTFRFLEEVLTEVIDLFPSHYIHIGGDEAGKGSWKQCADCQRRMKEEGLKDVDELQSYLIHRIEKFVNSKGRDIIGWDEILEGGLAPHATVMSWRGTAGGIKAIKAGHDVVMTPGEYYYLDYTQDAPFKEPISIGGFTPLKTAYGYDPADPSLTAEELKHLIGVQGNLWSEYVPTDAHAEYMYYPRAFAVAETGWSRTEDKEYGRFRENAVRLCGMLQKKGYNTFDIANEYGERKEAQTPIEHLAKGCKVTYNIPYSQQWPGLGDGALTDGKRGGWTYVDKSWQGTMKGFDVTVDLGQVKEIHYVGTTFMHSLGAWVHLPKKVTISVSADGKTFKQVGEVWESVASDLPKLLFMPYGITCHEKARYVRLQALTNDRKGSWLFMDELIVN